MRAGKAQATLVLPRSWLAHRWHGQAQLTLFLQLLQAAPNLPVWPLFGHNPPSPPRWGSTGPWPNVLRGFSKLASLSCTRPEHLALVAMVNPGSKSPTHSNQTRHLPPSTASPSKPPAQRMIHTIHLVSRAQNPGVTLGSSLPPLSPHRQAPHIHLFRDMYRVCSTLPAAGCSPSSSPCRLTAPLVPSPGAVGRPLNQSHHLSAK